MRKTASALGYAGRNLWRRHDLEDQDLVILDLVVEALDRLGRLYRPNENTPAVMAVNAAPSHVQRLLGK